MTVSLHSSPSNDTDAAEALVEHYGRVRAFTESLCAPLATEDYVVQSMPDTSPVKWHLAHTSWFFETFVLAAAKPGHSPYDPDFAFLFNSYYQTVGEMHSRPHRGLLSRPTVDEVFRYRAHVDDHVRAVLEHGLDTELGHVLILGLHHEQQHQELIVTDLKHMLSCNPLRPAYRRPGAAASALPPVGPMRWHEHAGGLQWVGQRGDAFAYDNEGPRHRRFLNPFLLASRLATCGEYLEFIADGGYQQPQLWLSEGWEAVQSRGWQAPLYWERRDDTWWIFTLEGMRPVDPHEPVVHLSYYEADAFANWTGYRLPTECEWEVVARELSVEGNFAENRLLHPIRAPQPVAESPGITQMYGDAWEWTLSPYSPYPGYRAPSGALGEYNGKFMCSQMVLRGGSCATPRDHMRPTYRNFFHPAARWQFSGVRLARDS